MKPQFFSGNRKAFADKLSAGSIALFFAGYAPVKTADEYYPHYTDRNFVYLTGIEENALILMIKKDENTFTETLFIQPPDLRAERWNGARIKADVASEVSGVTDIRYLADFARFFKQAVGCGFYDKLYLDTEKLTEVVADDESYKFAKIAREQFPGLLIRNSRPIMKMLRLIKQPCEIEAMRYAETITRDGIIAMMNASIPGLFEYQLKAEWDYALMQRGVLSPAFPSIVSAGANNFCIHYNSYTGVLNDGDMVLNDVGAKWDFMSNDVSRGWPVNGRFTERQRLLYTCALNTSDYMFSIIKPGMPMNEVDATARRYNYEQMRAAGVLDSFDDIGTYMWHGGAHHVGFDVHDVVATNDMPTMPIEAGMVFCVDIGIYHEEWGIGFRLEDNCLVTENGCENLSACTPRTIEEIGDIMRG